MRRYFAQRESLRLSPPPEHFLAGYFGYEAKPRFEGEVTVDNLPPPESDLPEFEP